MSAYQKEIWQIGCAPETSKMCCPKKYVNQKINVPSEVENHEFFSSNNVDIWSFKNFLLSFGDLENLSLNDIDSKKTEYIDSLNSLKLLANLDRVPVAYVSKLISEKVK